MAGGGDDDRLSCRPGTVEVASRREEAHTSSLALGRVEMADDVVMQVGASVGRLVVMRVASWRMTWPAWGGLVGERVVLFKLDLFHRSC